MVRPLLLLLAMLAVPALADDGAASIGVGGIIVMKRETRISMQKEVLRIGVHQVQVDYEFRNDTGEDVTTGVAFPIPPYAMEDRYTHQQQGFEDFKLTVEGKPVQFVIEARAKLKGKDVTAVLQKARVDVATFGHLSEKSGARDLDRLPDRERKALERAGLLENGGPMWTVEKKYFWTQTFPAHSTTHISHSYSPVLGFGQLVSESLSVGKERKALLEENYADPESNREVDSVCPTDELRAAVRANIASHGLGSLQYVDFILTTANTWRGPIGDFTLLVERPVDPYAKRYAVSFCWPLKVEQVDKNLFRATATNLTPAKELRIGYFALN